MGRLIDLSGQKFDRLLVIGKAINNKENRATWLCLCECGNQKIVVSKNLINGNTKSCGCLRKEVSSQNFKNDLSGMVFDRLTVLNEVGNKNGRIHWLCKCVCGNICEVPSTSLLTANTKSCGCLQRDITIQRSTSHGLSHLPEYQIWAAIKKRCFNVNDSFYHRYGGRGISVSERWLNSFENFYADMGPRPSDKHSIDRINNDGNYEPGNCRWSSYEDQAKNKSTTRYVSYNDKEIDLSSMAKLADVDYSKLKYRLNLGLSAEEAIALIKNENFGVEKCS